MVWLQFSESMHNKYQHETVTAEELNETQIHSLTAGGALRVSLVSAVNKAVLHLWTLICIIQKQDENKKYHLNFSKDSKFLSDIHSYKLLPLIESRFV